MDGGGRKLRSVTIDEASAFVRQDHHFLFHFPFLVRLISLFSFVLNETSLRLARIMANGRGALLTSALFVASILFGMNQGGYGASFLGYYSTTFRNLVIQTGFTVRSITVSGLSSLDTAEILAAADIDQTLPLIFLNIDGLRERISRLPLVRDVAIRKYYPDGLSIAVVEASPSALWQVDGSVYVVSDDGQVIAPLQDSPDDTLPLVVGPDAGPHVSEFLALLKSAPDLRPFIKAGVWVGGRRWTLNLKNGLDVFLPEGDVSSSLVRLSGLIRERHVLDKDIVSLDLRQSDRIILGLSDAAMLVRAESLKQKAKAKGAHA